MLLKKKLTLIFGNQEIKNLFLHDFRFLILNFFNKTMLLKFVVPLQQIDLSIKKNIASNKNIQIETTLTIVLTLFYSNFKFILITLLSISRKLPYKEINLAAETGELRTILLLKGQVRILINGNNSNPTAMREKDH